LNRSKQIDADASRDARTSPNRDVSREKRKKILRHSLPARRDGMAERSRVKH